ncbi:DUF3265 domain-containing protein [Aeromonas veronii]|nr:DUF3265 domain-containing protein [Aeromonas veronii]MBE8739044.1 DUF3265 domain-containing protein [Aeromonas veronii]MBE8745010.1 DUF3265 domain-containing protein [Aeromonas veronii]MBE8763815.1 DUF3265 domain-containing protein [Aeromonas veronii]MBE8840807.1 DUF3265 domain-containing protein [Aeromonas veronii]
MCLRVIHNAWHFGYTLSFVFRCVLIVCTDLVIT